MRPYSFFQKIDDHILDKYPQLWVTKLHFTILCVLIFSVFSFLIGLLFPYPNYHNYGLSYGKIDYLNFPSFYILSTFSILILSFWGFLISRTKIIIIKPFDVIKLSTFYFISIFFILGLFPISHLIGTAINLTQISSNPNEIDQINANVNDFRANILISSVACFGTIDKKPVVVLRRSKKKHFHTNLIEKDEISIGDRGYIPMGLYKYESLLLKCIHTHTLLDSLIKAKIIDSKSKAGFIGRDSYPYWFPELRFEEIPAPSEYELTAMAVLLFENEKNIKIDSATKALIKYWDIGGELKASMPVYYIHWKYSSKFLNDSVCPPPFTASSNLGGRISEISLKYFPNSQYIIINNINVSTELSAVIYKIRLLHILKEQIWEELVVPHLKKVIIIAVLMATLALLINHLRVLHLMISLSSLLTLIFTLRFFDLTSLFFKVILFSIPIIVSFIFLFCKNNNTLLQKIISLVFAFGLILIPCKLIGLPFVVSDQEMVITISIMLFSTYISMIVFEYPKKK